jgi:hypothetical protein
MLSLKRRTGLLRLVMAIALTGWGGQNALAQPGAAHQTAKEAMQASHDNKQYLFILFYDRKDAEFYSMEATVDNSAGNADQKVLVYKASVRNGDDSDLIAKYKIDRAPMPIVMVFGPNGAVLGGFPKNVTREKLARSLVPPIVMDVLKTVQERKMAVVLIQNSNTKFNAESSKTAQELAYDKRFAGKAEIIKADPADPKNKDFLANAKLLGDISVSAIILITPPGVVAGVYQGNMTKDSIISSLSSPCSGGNCGPGGCK